jgi:hypothetical protein
VNAAREITPIVFNMGSFPALRFRDYPGGNAIGRDPANWFGGKSSFL